MSDGHRTVVLMTLPIARLLVVDLDDTLWHWFDPWHKSFTALLVELEKKTGLSEDELAALIRPVHQMRGTSEYSWLLDELPELREFVPDGEDFASYYDPALHAQNRARKEATMLYPGVAETLEAVRRSGTKIVAYTESLEFWTRWRVHQTHLDGVLDELYSAPDHDSPRGIDPVSRRTQPSENYALEFTEHRHVPAGVTKPNSDILMQIVEDHEIEPAEAVYVGDSLMKDVAMAQSVGAIDVWARYGVMNKDPRYSLLQKVSHWPDATVAKEQDMAPGVHPEARHVLEESFSELLSFVSFSRTPGGHE